MITKLGWDGQINDRSSYHIDIDLDLDGTHIKASNR